jgi:hypothetical protein
MRFRVSAGRRRGPFRAGVSNRGIGVGVGKRVGGVRVGVSAGHSWGVGAGRVGGIASDGRTERAAIRVAVTIFVVGALAFFTLLLPQVVIFLFEAALIIGALVLAGGLLVLAVGGLVALRDRRAARRAAAPPPPRAEVEVPSKPLRDNGNLRLAIGDRIRHAEYGEGVVFGLGYLPSRASQLADVGFPAPAGVQRILVCTAPIEVVSRGDLAAN